METRLKHDTKHFLAYLSSSVCSQSPVYFARWCWSVRAVASDVSCGPVSAAQHSSSHHAAFWIVSTSDQTRSAPHDLCVMATLLSKLAAVLSKVVIFLLSGPQRYSSGGWSSPHQILTSTLLPQRCRVVCSQTSTCGLTSHSGETSRPFQVPEPFVRSFSGAVVLRQHS